MLIPTDTVMRRDFYEHLVEKCAKSRGERTETNGALYNYAFHGAKEEGRAAPYNKIGATLDTLCSLVYAPDSCKFDIVLGSTAGPEQVYWKQPLTKEITDVWRNSGTHLDYLAAIKLSLVYGCMLMNVVWDKNSGQCRTYLVDPHMFGVLREDHMKLSDQEAFCLFRTMSVTQLESDLEGNPRKNSIMASVVEDEEQGKTGTLGAGMKRLVIGGSVGGIPGSIAKNQSGSSHPDGGAAGNGGVEYSYTPKIDAVAIVEMVDLYIWEDEHQEEGKTVTAGYRIVTMSAPNNVIIYDRPYSGMGLGDKPPFVVVRPLVGIHDYFWGESFTARFAPFQDWLTERLGQIKGLLAKQFDPPSSAIGIAGIQEEQLVSMRSAGGQMSVSSPNGKFEFHRPEMPPDVFKEVDVIIKMFEDLAGLSNVMQGRGEAGVRSKGQTIALANLGAAPTKIKAVVTEESAEDVATLMLQNLQKFSAQKFVAKTPAGPLTFAASQFTRDYEVKVEGHSSSPIYQQEDVEKAKILLEAKAIDRATFLEIIDPPNVQLLLRRLVILEAKEAEQARISAALNVSEQSQTDKK